ncbi:hypothetical protein NPIL_501961 [Nephila pilipes]|uniref:Uncharacterized protein n=1 Tax=Nephila pilipes TaxID=299642 RepID=A0A8X6NWE4_NEPPI|nr:hypothetical protein NPIL_501961 [Nephila pilipes]
MKLVSLTYMFHHVTEEHEQVGKAVVSLSVSAGMAYSRKLSNADIAMLIGTSESEEESVSELKNHTSDEIESEVLKMILILVPTLKSEILKVSQNTVDKKDQESSREKVHQQLTQSRRDIKIFGEHSSGRRITAKSKTGTSKASGKGPEIEYQTGPQGRRARRREKLQRNVYSKDRKEDKKIASRRAPEGERGEAPRQFRGRPSTESSTRISKVRHIKQKGEKH